MSSTPDDRPRRGPPGRGPRGIRIAPSTGDVVPARKRPPRPEIDEDPSDGDIERFSNVTRECPECGKEVYDEAEVCYHCGYAFERQAVGTTKLPVWVFITVALMIGGFVIALVLGVI